MRYKAIPDRGLSRTCTSCFQVKNLHTDFHRNKCDSTGYRCVCKKCRNYSNSQKQYEVMILNGNKHVVECERCEGLMMKSATRKICLRCRRNNEK